jgi:type I restriction enzyme R subunit
MANNYTEAAFESAIERDFLANGYVALNESGFDRARAIFPDVALAFIRETQPKEWGKLEALHGPKTGDLVRADLCKWMDYHGCHATLRHGFKSYGRTLRIAFFRAAHGLNAELEARYQANRVAITRQLHYSTRNANSLPGRRQSAIRISNYDTTLLRPRLTWSRVRPNTPAKRMKKPRLLWFAWAALGLATL